MDRIFIPTLGATDWRRLLAGPRRQWRRTRSAYELAVAWEAARESRSGIPPFVEKTLNAMQDLAGATLVLGIPELQVELPGSGHASQTDLWALLDANGRLVSSAIEAKAGEPLGDSVIDWLAAGKKGNRRQERLASLCGTLCLDSKNLNEIRYQLLHRAASALIMADRFRASAALLLVISFNDKLDADSLLAFQSFGALYGTVLNAGAVERIPLSSGFPFYAGWISAPVASPSDLESAI